MTERRANSSGTAYQVAHSISKFLALSTVGGETTDAGAKIVY